VDDDVVQHRVRVGRHREGGGTVFLPLFFFERREILAHEGAQGPAGQGGTPNREFFCFVRIWGRIRCLRAVTYSPPGRRAGCCSSRPFPPRPVARPENRVRNPAQPRGKSNRVLS